jgi:hypothetical protein
MNLHKDFGCGSAYYSISLFWEPIGAGIDLRLLLQILTLRLFQTENKEDKKLSNKHFYYL